ncbi:MAG TPA: M57 family metalloprotease [Kofleriaceae bacterium]|jgi:hypothetical protein|nr:M57 family metalloprotease [Kofleriaceae bacterium]
MKTTSTTTALALALTFVGCTTDSTDSSGDETNEIVNNLVQAGYPADDIQVVDGTVYVGNDAEVTLDASREMIETDDSVDVKEQYHTKNLVSRSLNEICIYDGHLKGHPVFSDGLNRAIANYNALKLTFKMVRISKTNIDNTNCDALINVVFQAGAGGVSGFPSHGKPFTTVHIGRDTSSFGVNVVEWVFTHELGHTVGMRHSDYYNRAISCGGAPSNEGKGTVGAILVPGTPSKAKAHGSIMNSCFDGSENGEFTSTDVTALKKLY